MSCVLCLYASGGGGLEDADATAGGGGSAAVAAAATPTAAAAAAALEDNPSARQLLNGVPDAQWVRGPVLVCRAATGDSLNMEVRMVQGSAAASVIPNS